MDPVIFWRFYGTDVLTYECPLKKRVICKSSNQSESKVKGGVALETFFRIYQYDVNDSILFGGEI